MVSDGKRPYAVDKLYQNNLEQNVNGRKKMHGVTKHTISEVSLGIAATLNCKICK